ncbi:MAG: type III secretion system cytoplasmic ring protein SctQ [Aquisalimonadaceae bacterium]
METDVSGVRLGLGHDLLAAVLPPCVTMSDFRRLPEELRLAVLEVGMDTLLTHIEQRWGQRISLTAAAHADDADANRGHRWAFHLVDASNEALLGAGLLDVDPMGLPFMDRLLGALPGVRKRSFRELPVAISVEAARMSATVAELRGLQPGDVLCPGVAVSLDWVWLRLAAGPRCPARLNEGNVIVEEKWMDDENDNDRGDNDVFRVDELPVELSFELGRKQVPMGELETIGAGYVLTMGGITPSDVVIRANGLRVGRGELVQIGEELGVRVTELNGHGPD